MRRSSRRSAPVRGSCVACDVAEEDDAVVELEDVVVVVVVEDDPACEIGGADDSFLADPSPVPPCASAALAGESATRQASRSMLPRAVRRTVMKPDRMGRDVDTRRNASPSIRGSPTGAGARRRRSETAASARRARAPISE